MHSQTLKRQADDVSFNNDDDEYDVTWGSKKSRYIYTYNLQSPDLFPNINDSDQTDSVYSIQSKSTIEVADELDLNLEVSSQSSCGSDCDCNSQNSSQLDHTEFEVTNNTLLLDNGYLPDDTDTQEAILEENLPFLSSALFNTCSQCRRVNLNPYYQYCNDCFKYRMQLFESKPGSKPKSIKRLTKMSNYVQESGLCKNSRELNHLEHCPSYSQDSSCASISQEPCISNSQESGSFGISGLCVESLNNTIDMFQNSINLCSVCLLKPKNGIFNHGKSAHVYCCYNCAKQIWNRSGKCPICNLKIRYVTKLNIVR